LTSLTGLGGITSIGGGLSVSMNSLLTNLAGLENLSSIGASFSITSNASLTSLSGLGGLHTVGITFNISGNPLLTSLIPLGGLTSIGGPLTVSSNASLTSLSGLDNIASTSITFVNLVTNANLSYCGVTSICNYLSVPANPANIFSNTTGCNSKAEVQASCLPLPIELLAFEAEEQGRNCLLSWRTASEHANSHFELENSRNGVSFEKIGSVEGNGTSFKSQDYEFLHQSPIPGTNYYRLKQYNWDGTFSYSAIKSITISDNKAVLVYPNPITTGRFRVALDQLSEGNMTLCIHKIDGSVVWSQVVPRDVTEQVINIKDLATGIYILQVTYENGQVFRQKILKY